MINILIDFLREWGINSATLILVIVGGIMSFTNHLKHINRRLTCLEEKIINILKKVSFIEGLIEGKKENKKDVYN